MVALHFYHSRFMALLLFYAFLYFLFLHTPYGNSITVCDIFIIYYKCVLGTLPPAYLSCEFAFRARFQRVVRALDLNYVENAYHCISTHCEIHEYSLRT